MAVDRANNAPMHAKEEQLADTADVSAAVVVIAAMATPALFIVGSASLVSSALARMARIVDRARLLTAAANEGAPEKVGVTAEVLSEWLARHAQRARYTELSIAALYGAVVVFVATALSIALDRAVKGAVAWLPVALAVLGAGLLVAGGASMVFESRLANDQIKEEIQRAAERLKETRK
jgi:hypothetical protein